MSGHTVKQVARLSGVSIRTLHHYDEIGLLKPASVGANSYRYYGREELLRLQQILFHRELGLALEDIRRLLDAPGFDRIAALKAHRTKLLADAQRYRQLVRTIDDTLAALEGERMMEDKAMYRGFDPKKQAEREAELVARYGEKMQARLDHAKRGMKHWKQADFDQMSAEVEAIEADFAKSLADGVPADSDAVRAVVRRQHAWIARSWSNVPTAEAFAGLARLYADHPDFRARYEARQPGLTEYMCEAMQRFAEKEL